MQSRRKDVTGDTIVFNLFPGAWEYYFRDKQNGSKLSRVTVFSLRRVDTVRIPVPDGLPEYDVECVVQRPAII